MRIEEPAIRLKIRRLIEKTVNPSDLHDDFTQEAWLHLWQTEAKYPGRTLSWYYQSIRFHVQHLLQQGRSVDALKRRNIVHSIEDDKNAVVLHNLGVDHLCPLCHASARDFLLQLRNCLDEVAGQVLTLLADGHGIREIASRTGVSPAMVLKHRGKIATAARRLGIDR